MITDELRKLLRKNEGETLEFKLSTGQRIEAVRTLCAMLNGLGGVVVFGADDKGKPIGQMISSKTLDEVAAEIRKIEPPAFPNIEQVELENEKYLLVIRVPGNTGLFTYDAKPYVRVGSTTRLMPKREYELRVAQSLHSTIRWETTPCPPSVSIKDLDSNSIRESLQEGIRLGRIDPKASKNLTSILEAFGLIQEGRLINAAVALFGKSEKLHGLYPQFSMRVGRFRGTNRLADFADNRFLWGNIYELLQHAERFLMDHVPIAGRVIPGKMKREDQPMYPPRATREALANAFCHRDYSVAGASVSVAMYDDHLEIINPGKLHFGVTPHKLTRPHESKPWNPVIANVLFRSGVIEKWGTGTLNILDWCQENKNPSPSWHEDNESVYVTFTPATLPEQIHAGQVNGQVAGQVSGQVAGQVAGQVDGKWMLALTTLQQGSMKSAQLQELVGMKHRETFQRNFLDQWLSRGLVERTIPDKPQSRMQQYRLTAQGMQWLKEHT